ncbi:MAG: cell division protein ZapD [Woeseiaceae bacterium]|nr:cell division protein ZapD [Woeseiaceae bacterium]
MARAAPNVEQPSARQPLSEYEQPLNERMRTFMRLEFLYQQLLYNSEQEADWATRAATGSLLEIMAILGRGDVRSDVHKELDRQLERLERFRSQPGVDGKRLAATIGNLQQNRDGLRAIGANFLQPLKDCEFLSSIKHRSAIPGGTCEFDLPEYSHWVRQSFARRQQDLMNWVNVIRPVCDAVMELLWLLRESADPGERVAVNGMYQHNVQRDAHNQILRVTLPAGQPFIPGDQRRPAPLHDPLSRMVDHRPARRANRPRRPVPPQHLLTAAVRHTTDRCSRRARTQRRRWAPGGLFRAVRDRDVEPGAYTDVLAASLNSPPGRAFADHRSQSSMNNPDQRTP